MRLVIDTNVLLSALMRERTERSELHPTIANFCGGYS
jgi:predicted nucleic acid-binding protein